MANILDIRRRIRSVINTRQITKAMKTVSAAKLRRAQEAALAARPYSQMLTNVLKSLVKRADIYDPITGEPLHPLLAERPEKNILLIVVTGDKGLAGAFNTNISEDREPGSSPRSPNRILTSNASAARDATSCAGVSHPLLQNAMSKASRRARRQFRAKSRAPAACRSSANMLACSAKSITTSSRLSAQESSTASPNELIDGVYILL